MHNESNLPAIAERKTLGRRSVVRGAAWAAPVVGLAAAAPAYAASTTFPIPILGAARWEWGNPSHNWIFRGITVCADRPIVAGDLTITITAPNSLTHAAAASNAATIATSTTTTAWTTGTVPTTTRQAS